ncbi:MAG: hypothetical protein WC628_02665 [Candidatus Omnitrophota bacterium]
MEFIKRHYRLIVILSLAGYFFYAAENFFLSKTAPFFDRGFFNYPLLQDDYAMHFTHAHEAALFFKTHLRLWGYSPYHCAGFLTGVFESLSNNWAFLIMLIFGALGKPEFIFNLAIFSSYLVYPIAAFFIARNFNLGKINSLFFLIFSLFLVMGFRKAADLANFSSYGMYGFPLAVNLSFWAASCFYKYIQDKTNKNLIGLTITGCFAVFVHPLSFIICLALTLPILLAYFHRLKLKDIYKIAASAFIVMAINLLWIAPFIEFSYLKGPAANYFQTDWQSFWRLFAKQPSFVLLILFLISVFQSYRYKERRLIVCLLSSWCLFFVVSFFGTQIGLGNIQPYRFVLPLSLLSLLLTCGIAETQLKKKDFIFILLLILLAVFLNSRPKKYDFGFRRYPAANEILQFIKEHTSPGARIHVQDSSSDPYFGSHFTALIPYYTGREIVAAPCPFPQDKFTFAQFVDGNIFQKELNNLSEQELAKYMELYNIKYFLVFSQQAHEYFSKNMKFKKVFSRAEFGIYEYAGASDSYCYQCQAIVEAGYDSIKVKNAFAKKTILKYHYLSTLKIKPENLIIQPIKLMDDPIPFIMVENGDCHDFTIYNP